MECTYPFSNVHSTYTNYGKCWWERCSLKEGDPSNVNVELFSPTGKYKLHASCLDLNVQVRGSVEIELGFENREVDDFLFVPGYDIRGSMVAQANPILGVHIYLYSDDFTNVDCPKGSKNLPGDLGLG
ncbi:hypothetical protein CQW23_07497 [Capsicum baccatum]|uniref:Uncharacterized protein n=1 Tax=Capsicum baccatum TaxID=33114 RepID=A0A2G2X6A2_CAPBA|nr:hypothetical protein CQW23_07497 [Capsicum baccatum]